MPYIQPFISTCSVITLKNNALSIVLGPALLVGTALTTCVMEALCFSYESTSSAIVGLICFWRYAGAGLPFINLNTLYLLMYRFVSHSLLEQYFAVHPLYCT